MAEKNDQTNKDPDPDLAAQLAAALADNQKLAEDRDKIAKEAKLHQITRDRLQHQIDTRKAVLPPAKGADGKEDPGLARLQELEAQANESNRRIMILTELSARGLKETDLVDADIDVELCESPVELKLALDNLLMKRQLRDVDKWRKESGTPPPSKPKIDAGGSTDTGGGSGEQADAQLRARYDKAKEKGRTPEGQWLMLDAIHHDPNKLMNRVPQEEE